MFTINGITNILEKNMKSEHNPMFDKVNALKSALDGELFCDQVSRLIYATDASVYREVPLAIARPANKEDVKKLIAFAGDNGVSIIPRATGTSLAGQVVGAGIVLDVTKHFNKIIELNQEEKWVRVEPGLVLDELNLYLKPYGLFFAPETSTSKICCIGGMVGNNSAGANSIIYGSTRDHVLSIKTILSDSSEAEFTPLNQEEFLHKCQGDQLENRIYQNIRDILENPVNQKEIRNEYPEPSLIRRNTGYALDLLLDTAPFIEEKKQADSHKNAFNFSKLLAGSEGTLAFTSEIKLNLVPLAPEKKALICAHFHSVMDAIKANVIVLKHQPTSVELIDKIILDCTKENIEQRRNRFFLKGDPKAVLIIEFVKESRGLIVEAKEKIEQDLRKAGLGYHFPLIDDQDINKVWALRKAGLGVLSNIPGDAKPVAVIEDSSVNVAVLEEYIQDFQNIVAEYQLECVYYAHISVGELHLRPVLNLKDPKDIELFHTIAEKTAQLVKKYRGSLSGEHGDGRLRGEFIPLMIGEHNYSLLKKIKETWDPHNILNPGKIVNTPQMNTSLRYQPGQQIREIQTMYDFDSVGGILRAAEKCNGSGECRKSDLMGGTMCPSYMAGKEESASTRARANIVREFLTHSHKNNPFDHQEIYDIMDFCLACKGCKSECPSNVDVAKLKSEFLYQFYKSNRIPLRTLLIAFIPDINKFAALMPSILNYVLTTKWTAVLIKKMLGFTSKRNMPILYRSTFRKWMKKNVSLLNQAKSKPNKTVYFFVDEIINYYDVEIGIKGVLLLTKLGYHIEIPSHSDSGRVIMSKGLLKKAKKLANENVQRLATLVQSDKPLIGIEPSCILSFRDEYPDLVDKDLVEEAKQLAANCFTIDEFIAREIQAGNILKNQFGREAKKILLHGHCQQKAISSTETTKIMLSLPKNYSVEEIKSGCCGMAGAFGFEKEHYELSMKVGELHLFPAIRKAGKETIIAATGNSCRQQIMDGTGKKAYHPVEILFDALE